MESLLKNDTFALSALVSSKPDGQFDFEINPLALSDYQNSQSGEFFRFLKPGSDQAFQESLGAPQIGCQIKTSGSATGHQTVSGRRYRTRSTVFQPEVDGEFRQHPSFSREWVCLVVGVDEAPYQALVVQTLFSTVPILVVLVLAMIGILLFLVKKLTRDLSQLALSLETADFGATHAFPTLPDTQTAEVKAVVEKLQALHHQAADVYREMWLFLGRAAHQLKTPATAIQTTLQVLLRKERSKEDLVLGLYDLEAAVELLTQLTKKLISSSRISYDSAPKIEAIELAEFFAEQLKVFRSQTENRKIKILIDPSIPLKILGNSTLLAELFGNLLENALLYSPVDSQINIRWRTEGENAVIYICDQGPGFSDSVKEALFQPFVRGDERLVVGSGLGLSIAKKSANLLGGDLSLEKSTSQGSTLKVILPKSGSGKK